MALPVEKISPVEKLRQFTDYWNPKIVAELNGQQVKLVKVNGQFTWHHHDNEDELFLLLEGDFSIELRDKTIHLDKGEFVVIPRGVEHRPVSNGEAHILLFEPASTLNTGNVQNDFTKNAIDKI